MLLRILLLAVLVGVALGRSTFETTTTTTTEPSQKNSTTPDERATLVMITEDSWSSKLMTALIPLKNFALSSGLNLIGNLYKSVGVLILGVIFTSGICSLTSFCSINIPYFGIGDRPAIEQVAEIARSFMGGDNPMLTTIFTEVLQKSVEKANSLPTTQSPVYTE